MKRSNSQKKKGIPSDSILRIVGQLESTEICIPLKFELMRCLIPKQSIPEEAFIRLTCLLSDFQFNLNLKVEILKWMISVYSFVDNLCNFLDLIEVFLHLLNYEALQPYACHLLCKMAKKEHVTKHRLNYIADLLQKYEPQPCLVVLMFSFYKLNPRSIIEPKEDIKFNFEPLGIYPNLIQNAHPSYDIHIPACHFLNNDKNPVPPCCLTVEKPLQVLSKAHSSNYKSFDTYSDTNAIQSWACPAYTAAMNVQKEFLALYEEFKSMEGPTKVQDILKNKCRRLFLTSDISERKKTSIEDFILVSMYTNLESADFLRNSLEIFHYGQKSVPGMSAFTEKYIGQCDGPSDLDIVMGLLLHEPPCTFEEIEYKLALIHEKLLNASVFKKCDHINGLSDLYQHWVLKVYKHGYLAADQRCSSSNVSSAISEDPSVAIHKLGNYIALVCDAYLLDNNFHPCLLNEILLHYERVSRCHMVVNKLVMHPPTTTVFHTALFSLNSVTLESLCRLMIRYYDEIKTMRRMKHPESHLAWIYFKRFCNDILSVMEGKYNSKEVTHLSNENVIQSMKMKCKNFATFFEMHRHPALIQKTASFIENCEMDISPSSIKNVPRIRKDFLKYLEHNGQESLVELYNQMTVNKRKKSRN